MFKKIHFSALLLFTFGHALTGQTDVRLVREGKLYGYKNAKNEWVIEPKYEIIEAPFSNLMIARNEEKLLGLIDDKGDMLVPFEFQSIRKMQGSGFNRGGKQYYFDAILVQKVGKWGMIDRKGRILVPHDYEVAEWVDDSTVFFSRLGRQILRNNEGQTILETNFDNVTLLKASFPTLRYLIATQNDRSGIVDFLGKTVVPFKFRKIRFLPPGNIVDVQNEKNEHGIWDLMGRELIAPKFSMLRFLNDSFFTSSLLDRSEIGLFDIAGRQRMPFEFQDIRIVGSSDRLKAHKKDDFYGLFDTEGRALTFPILADFEANKALPNLIFAKEQSGEWLVVNREGRHINQDRFDKFSDVQETGFVAYKGGLSAIFLPDGQRITPFKYRYVRLFAQKSQTRKDEKAHGLNTETYFVGNTKDTGEWQLIDNFGKEYPFEPRKEQPQKSKTAENPLSPSDIEAEDDTQKMDDTQKVYDFPSKQAQFPGGETAMLQFYANNIKYPSEAKKMGIQGRVVIQFVVEKDGSLTSFILLRDIGSGCGMSAIEATKLMPRWLPAEHNGKTVRAKGVASVWFRLD
jgi:TonB family protein